MAVLSKNLKIDKEKSNFTSVEYQDSEEIYFPNICIICGINTEKRLKKSHHTSYSATRDYKKDYHFNLPVCQECQNKIHMKSGISSKSGKIFFLSSLFGVVFAIILQFIFYSIILSLSIAAISIIFPYFYHRNKLKMKIKFYKFLTINLNERDNTIKLNFINRNYVKLLNEIKLQKEEENDNKKLNEEQIISGDPNKEELSGKYSKESVSTKEKLSETVIASPDMNKVILHNIDRCPQCKSQISQDMKYCMNCGAILK